MVVDNKRNSVQPYEFKFYREPTYEMIVKENEILTTNYNSFRKDGTALNIYWIHSQSIQVGYRLVIEDHQVYPDFKVGYCTCLSNAI